MQHLRLRPQGGSGGPKIEKNILGLKPALTIVKSDPTTKN